MREIILEKRFFEAFDEGTRVVTATGREGVIRSYNETDGTYMVEFENGEVVQYAKGSVRKAEE